MDLQFRPQRCHLHRYPLSFTEHMEERGRASVAVIVREQNDVGKGIATGVKV